MKRFTGAQALALRDALEEDVQAATDRAVKSFLSRVVRHCRAGLRDPRAAQLAASAVPSGPASSAPAGGLEVMQAESLMTYGDAARWWGDASVKAVAGIINTWDKVYQEQGVTFDKDAGSSLDPAAPYLANVKDRLVQGIQPPLPDMAFDAVRQEAAYAIGQGLSSSQLATNIAKKLSWDPEREYWEKEYDSAASSISAMLDPLGPPGSPAREKFKAVDPQVRSLQDRMAEARLAMDRNESVWKTRATRIARTETTGAYNWASLNALASEGVEKKVWMAVEDSRTRPSHAAADGQSVPLDHAFTVGGSSLMMPCDPSAPAKESVNCRCVVVGDWDNEDTREMEETEAPQDSPGPKKSRSTPSDEPVPPSRPLLPEDSDDSLSQDEARPFVDDYTRRRLDVGISEDQVRREAELLQQILTSSRSWADAYAELEKAYRSGLIDDIVSSPWDYKDVYARWELAHDPNHNSAYLAALKTYTEELEAYRAKLRAWATEHDVAALTGMKDAKNFSGKAGPSWAHKTLARFDEEAADAWRHYSGSDFTRINRELRAGKVSEKIRKWVTAMDRGFSPSDQDVYLRRSTNFAEFLVPGRTEGHRKDLWTAEDLKKLVGTVQEMPSYTSTSVTRTAAVPGNVNIIYKVPKGTMLADVMQSSEFGDREGEVVLPRGSRVYIHKASQKQNGTWIIEAEVLPPDRPAEFYEGLGIPDPANIRS